MSDRTRLTKEMSQLSPERRTTMPQIGAPPDPRRPMAGPPQKGLDEAIKLSAQKGPLEGLHLLDFVTEQQQREDAATWFEGAKDYIERTAIIDQMRRELFTAIPWTGDDLKARVDRITKLEILIDSWRANVDRAEQTLKAERADAVRMADTHVTQLDLQVRQPATPEADRADLQKLADMPLGIWRARSAKIQKTRDKNERLRNPAQPTAALDAAAPMTLPAASPPGRRGRKR